jgi:outer membrane beta-barrel protein
MKKNVITKILLVIVLSLEAVVAGRAFSASQDKRFKDIEIRVIRPKYFSKSSKFELGAQATVITNQTFIYTFMASGLMTFHFSEALGLEVAGSYGVSLDKNDKTLLKDEFDINTIIFRTEYIFSGALLWTPIYGKFQTDEGSLIYFDTFLSFGGGLTGIDYQYDHCPTVNFNEEPLDVPTPQTKSYPTFFGGLGQRFFLNKTTAFRWDARMMFFSYDLAHGECNQEFAEEGLTNSQQNVTIQIGASKFL